MRNKVIALAVMINTILVMIGAPQSQAVSDEAVLNRQKAVRLLRENSTDIWKAAEEERLAKEDYETEVSKAKGINTTKMFLYHNPFTDEDVYYYFEPVEQMQMRMMKELIPESAKLGWEMKELSRKITENAMSNAADSLFTGLYSTYQNKIIAGKSLELAKKVYEREEVRYRNGLITELDLEGAKLDLLSAENALKKAERDYDNMHRQFNSKAGLALDFRYELIGTPYITNNQITISEDKAVADALANRIEIRSLKRQIELKEFQMEIYRHKNVHLTNKDAKKDYAQAQEDVENLKIQLAEKEYAITKEIKQAYQDLKLAYVDLELTKINLAKMKNQLETVNTQYRSGFVPISVVEQLEQGIYQLEYAVNMNMIVTLNKQDQFSRAISVGPGY